MRRTTLGDFDRKIDLLKPIAQGKWKVMASVWAVIRRPSIRSGAMLGSAAAVVVTQGFTIRRHEGVKKGWRVRYDGDIYDIIHVDESVIDEMTLTCKDIAVNT